MIPHGCAKKDSVPIVLLLGSTAMYIVAFPFLYPFLKFFTGSFSLVPVVLAGMFYRMWGGIIGAVVISGINYFLFHGFSQETSSLLFSFYLPNGLAVVVGSLVGWFRHLYCELHQRVKDVEEKQKLLEASLQHSKMVEAALAESEERFRKLFRTTNDIVCFVNASGFLAEVNPAGESFIGYTQETLRQLKFSDVVSPEYAERVKRLHLRQYLLKIDNVYNEAPFQTNAHTLRWLGYTATLIYSGDTFHGFYIVARDITAQRVSLENVRKEQEELDQKIRERTAELVKANQALQIEIRERTWIEEALRESEEKYRSLVENMRDIVFRLSTDSTITFLNQAWEVITGYSNAESINKPFLSFVLPEFHERVQSLLDALHENNTDCLHCEFMIRTAYGSFRWMEVHFTPSFSAQGEYNGIEGILHDVTEIKETRDALQKSKEFLDKIVNSISEPIFVKDSEHRWVLVNDAFATLLAKTKDELLGKSDYEFFPKEQADVFWAKDSLVLETGITDVNEELLRDATGRDRIISTIKTLYTDEHGNKYIVGIIRDITEEKEVEHRIRELNAELDRRVQERTQQLLQANQELRTEIIERQRAEEQLRLFEHAFKSVQEGIFITTLNGTLLFGNEAFCTMLGYPSTELEGKSLFEFVDKQLLQELYQKILKEEESGGGWQGKLQQKTKRGGVFPAFLSLSVIKNADDVPVSIIGIMQDRTAEEHTAAQLRRLSSTVEQSPVAIVITDLSGNIEHVNEHFCSMTGYTKDELSGCNIRILKSGETKPDEYAELWSTIRSGREWRGVFHNKKKTGELYWDSTIIYPLKNEHNVTTHYIAFKEDVTERRKLEAQIRRSQRLEVIGTLAGGIAHDLNNVLSPVLMAVQLLRMKISDPKGLQLLSTLESTVNRGADIVKQILAFARGSEGERMLVQPKHLLREVHEIMQETFPRQITLQAEIPKDLWPVLGDATQLHQVLMNLCVNARDAMPHGGTLTLRAENIELNEQQAAIHVDAKPGPYILISVIDTGVGIPPENLDKIFDPFFTTKEVGKGTGLGLATVQTIVRSHQGFVTVYSEVGRGTHFKVYLPAAQHSASAQRATKPSEPPKGRGELVLLIDDEHSIREVTKQLLENANYRVLVASDGVEALEIFKQNPQAIDVVITDMMMPNMDGAGVIRTFSQLNPQTKIIAASGLVSNENMAEVRSTNVHAFLPKPYNAEKLFWVLDTLLH